MPTASNEEDTKKESSIPVENSNPNPNISKKEEQTEIKETTQSTEPEPKMIKKPQPSKKKITLSDFELVGRLGKGSYGEVELHMKKDNQKLYAIKSLDKNFLYRVGISYI